MTLNLTPGTEGYQKAYDRRLVGLQRFIHESSSRNAWIDYGPMKVYMRRSNRVLGGRAMRCLDIATVTINEEEHRGQGVFKEFLSSILLQWPVLLDFDTLFIENVVNSGLAAHLESQLQGQMFLTAWRDPLDIPSYYLKEDFAR